ncbi:hypothetical protein LZ30DRAFT_708114 [Colletotrichum cereale]|nr:hypothetical protein LZ30DRAFT_708114 [Colletotrichum cereale]
MNSIKKRPKRNGKVWRSGHVLISVGCSPRFLPSRFCAVRSYWRPPLCRLRRRRLFWTWAALGISGGDKGQGQAQRGRGPRGGCTERSGRGKEKPPIHTYSLQVSLPFSVHSEQTRRHAPPRKPAYTAHELGMASRHGCDAAAAMNRNFRHLPPSLPCRC